MKARSMLDNLFDPTDEEAVKEREDLFSKYQVITKKDLKAETALLESFMSCQRHKHASWIWYFEDRIGGEAAEFIRNSKLGIVLIYSIQ